MFAPFNFKKTTIMSSTAPQNNSNSRLTLVLVLFGVLIFAVAPLVIQQTSLSTSPRSSSSSKSLNLNNDLDSVQSSPAPKTSNDDVATSKKKIEQKKETKTTNPPGPAPTTFSSATKGFQNPPDWTFLPFTPPKLLNESIRTALVTILKREQNYVTDWVKYHLAIGFDLIYLYDNEDDPTYAKIIRNEGMADSVIEVPYKQSCPDNWSVDKHRVIVKHLPTSILMNVARDQHRASLDDWWVFHANQDKVTHVAHWDIDEFVLFKKHETVRDFVKDYMMEGGNKFERKCAAHTFHWKFFGTNGLTRYSPDPVPLRFTCGGKTNKLRVSALCKLFTRVDAVTGIDIHWVHPKPGLTICDTMGRKGVCPPHNGFNWDFQTDVVQLNHYQCHTWEEYTFLRKRGSSIVKGHKRSMDEIVFIFNAHNQMEEVDYGVRNKYLKHVLKLDDEAIKKYPDYPGSKCEAQPPMTKPPGEN
jgi:hypothetical protein